MELLDLYYNGLQIFYLGIRCLYVLLELYSFFELLDCSAINCHCPGLSLDHTARIARTENH